MAPAGRPYHDFVTPAFHRHIVKGALYTLGACYVVALLMGSWNHFFWSWFPFGATGVRALLLFISSLLVFILRLANWHVGERATEKPSQTFFKYAFRAHTFTTFAFYTLSAWFFGEVYIWSQSSSAKLEFTDPGKLHERIRLNERPIFLRFFFVLLAFGQALIHLWHDYDRMPIPVNKAKQDRRASEQTRSPLATAPSPSGQLNNRKSELLTRSAGLATVVAFLGLFLYFGLFRGFIWRWSYLFARNFVSLAKTTKPQHLVGGIALWVRFLFEGFYLAFLWNFTNTTFDVLIAQEPLKNDKPITFDSKDPNGSLLNGLKSKRDVTKNIAFWELAIITDRFDDRRKSLFTDEDRPKGPAWKQVVAICLAEIRNITLRIDGVQFPSQGTALPLKGPEPVNLVPRISQPLNEDKVTGPMAPPVTRLEKIENVSGSFARTHSSPENAADAKARQLIRSSAQKVDQLGRDSGGVMQQYWIKLCGSMFGFPFRACFRRTAKLVINGGPYSRINLIANSIATLTRLSTASLQEDLHGQYHKEIPEIVRTFCTVINKIDSFLQALPIEATDLDCLATPEAERKKVPEVEIVVALLRDGLERILRAFAEYLAELGLSQAEIRQAKELAAKSGRNV